MKQLPGILLLLLSSCAVQAQDKTNDKVNKPIQLEQAREQAGRGRMDRAGLFLCEVKMNRILRNNENVIQLGVLGGLVGEYFLGNVDGVKNKEEKACVNHLLNKHVDAVLQACRYYKCGNYIRGGCTRISRESAPKNIYQEAVKRCRI